MLKFADNDERENGQVGWGFWLQWVLASFVVGGIGFLTGLFFVLIGGGAICSGIIVVVGMGIAQWLFLRRRVSQVGKWMSVNFVAIFILFYVTTGVFVSTVKNAFLSVERGFDLLFIFAIVLTVYTAISGNIVVWMIRKNATTR
jgi:hypothetical protein